MKTNNNGIDRPTLEAAIDSIKEQILSAFDEGLGNINIHSQREPEEIGIYDPDYDPSSNFVQRKNGPELIIEIRLWR